jgi:hypothetical protein
MQHRPSTIFNLDDPHWLNLFSLFLWLVEYCIFMRTTYSSCVLHHFIYTLEFLKWFLLQCMGVYSWYFIKRNQLFMQSSTENSQSQPLSHMHELFMQSSNSPWHLVFVNYCLTLHVTYHIIHFCSHPLTR